MNELWEEKNAWFMFGGPFGGIEMATLRFQPLKNVLIFVTLPHNNQPNKWGYMEAKKV